MNVYELCNAFVERFATLSPMKATFAGIAGHDHEWDDLSPKGHAARADLYRETLRALDALPPTGERFERHAGRVLRDFLTQLLDADQSHEHELDLNNLASPFQDLRQVFDMMDTKSKSGLHNIAARLETIDRAARGYRETLAAGLAAGRRVARRQVLAAIQQGRVSQGEQSFFLTLLESCQDSGHCDAALKARLDAGVETARRAFGELSDWLETSYLPGAAERDPVGRERYVRAAARHLGMQIDPLETYAWGLGEVRALELAMRETAAQIDAAKTVREVVELLETDPQRSASSHEEFVRIVLEHQQRALAKLAGEHFDVPAPIRRIDVKIAPPGGALGAYYIPPSEDFSRPGTVWYSPGTRSALPLWSEITTAYHEGFPGHHLQCGIQVSLADKLSRAQRLLIWYAGSGEGWALYAEHLMNELGYLDKPEYVLGMLSAQMMRACRVVVDIGLHLELAIPSDWEFHAGETWSYELAVELLTSRAFLPRDHAESEVTRYLGWPGQAIAYKVGQRAILALREELRQRLGAGFSLKEFHRRVLECGSIGLPLLRETVLASA